jgi:hypothetical protein
MTDPGGQVSVNTRRPKMFRNKKRRRKKGKRINKGHNFTNWDVSENTTVHDGTEAENQQKSGHTIIKGVHKMKVCGMIEGTPVEWKIDTGATRTFISRET